MPEQKHQIIQPTITGEGFSVESPRQPYNGPTPTVLLILDGWGIGPKNAGNAITLANTPNMDLFWLSFPHANLSASGEAVGLPRGEDGNSETGHLNIGAGNIVYQDLPRVNMSIADGSFARNQTFAAAFSHVKNNNSALHIMGLAGSGGVHANLEHMLTLLEMAKKENISKVYLHLFTDGRDSPPYQAPEIIEKIQEICNSLGVGEIATVVGRFYAMDRDQRWDRVERAYHALVSGDGQVTNDPISAVVNQHQARNTDEFIEPIKVLDKDGQVVTINDDDAVIFTNYRIDRPRELTRAFVITDFSAPQTVDFDPYLEKYEKTNALQGKATGATFERKKVVKNLFFVTMTRYEEGLPVAEAFPPQPVREPLCKVFAQYGLKQLRAAETEKQKFVTYYMNGQKELIFPGEDRVILPSKDVKSYDELPEMSAREIGAEVVTRVENADYDAMVINLANGDMVGHTGNLEAGIKACEVVDEVVGQIVRAVYQKGGVVLITADHGNVEEMINMESGEVDTEHSIYPVPLIIVGQAYFNQSRTLPNGVLADIAPTMLAIMGLEKPIAMTGRSLI